MDASFRVNVVDVNEPPTITNAAAPYEIDEGSGAGTHFDNGAPAVVADVDGADQGELALALSPASPCFRAEVDAASSEVQLVVDDGADADADCTNFEADGGNPHHFDLTVSDTGWTSTVGSKTWSRGALNATTQITVQLRDVNEPPSLAADCSPLRTNVARDSQGGQAVYDLSRCLVDEDAGRSFDSSSLVEGNSSAAFSINPPTGMLSLGEAGLHDDHVEGTTPPPRASTTSAGFHLDVEVR